MSDRAALRRLCGFHGIAVDYEDIWGRRHEVPEHVLRAVLTARGAPAEPDTDLGQALGGAENRAWRLRIPPATVLWETDPAPRVTLTLGERELHSPLDLTLIPEAGAPRSWSCPPGDFQALATRTVAGELRHRVGIPLPELPAPGYHRLELRLADGGMDVTRLIVAPARAHRPAALEGDGRIWGITVQLYGLRSRRNWGIGDFSDLRRLLELAAQAGAGVVGISPLHALDPLRPDAASPYSPGSRQFLNPLFLDVEAVPELAECPELRERIAGPGFQARLRALRAAELVDYPGVAALKHDLLEALYAHFRARHLEAGTPRGEAFRDWRREQGDRLQLYALHQALAEHLREAHPQAAHWPDWPPEYQDPRTDTVQAVARERAPRLDFHAWLQWEARRQLEAAGRRAWELGLGVGIFQDLALAEAPDGAAAWSDPTLYPPGVRVGAPPDDFNLAGQDWGLPPWDPDALVRRGFQPFIELLRANMGVAGALRLDHAMSLLRLFWIPPGAGQGEGAYVHYPFADLLGILALESRRNECLVVGEDLGTVPAEVREGLTRIGALGYRLLLFEREEDGGFPPPGAYAEEAALAVSTHDLPTLAGFWEGVDLAHRHSLGLFPDAAVHGRELVTRAADRARLLLALERDGLLPADTGPDPAQTPGMTPELSVAVHQQLARSPSRLLLIQAEDLLGQREQVNLPGSGTGHPNWRRKLTENLEDWSALPRVRRLLAAVRAERGTAVRAPRLVAGQGPRQAVIPRATYRLQLHGGFTFRDAAAAAPHLAALGVSHVYCSPYLEARPGSAHGYDIVDHGALNPEIGSREDYEHFTRVLRGLGMSQVLDMVPNHMAVMGQDNGWWLDVLKHGPASAYARYFDIDWQPADAALRGKVIVPVLGDHYGAILDQGDLRLSADLEHGSFSVYYWEHRFPVDPREYPRILGHGRECLSGRVDGEHPALAEFDSLVRAFGNLPPREEESADGERERDATFLETRLAQLCGEHEEVARAVQDCVARLQDEPDHQGFHELLEAQAYRLAYWRVASDRINYRRFFDINDLAGLRMEDPAVFEATHELVLGLVARGDVQGLRIDHPDGLYDPAGYFRRLQERVGETRPPGPDGAPSRLPLYLVVEKILAGDEALPADWAVHGTTGYEFARLCDGLFVDPAGREALDRIYARQAAGMAPFPEILYRSKRLIMRVSLNSELNVLATQLARIAERDRHTRDFTRESLHDALLEIVACFPVYRTYVSAEGASPADRDVVDRATAAAKQRSRAADISVFDFVREVLLTTIAHGQAADYREAVVRFAMRFQQYSGPVMAKGMEDTAFYRFHRLTSLNEVGGEPDVFDCAPETFHAASRERAERWPHAMLSSSTHDSKRSEDVRARIHALSELPEAWSEAVAEWARVNAPLRRRVGEHSWPDANTEYLLYQTLLGVWPLQEEPGTLEGLRERVEAYMLKAVREAKEHTSWINPDLAYESVLRAFVAGVLSPERGTDFLARFRPLQRRVAWLGLLSSLSALLIRLTAPGVPDIYQGNERWVYTLVDPDNRGAVDFAGAHAALESLQAEAVGATPATLRRIAADAWDGRAKLLVTWQTLQLRARLGELYRSGDYLPLGTAGTHGARVLAFARVRGGQGALTIAPRLMAPLCPAPGDLPLGPVWEDTVVGPIPAGLGGRWRNVYTAEVRELEAGGQAPVADLLASFPVGLWVRAEDGGAPA